MIEQICNKKHIIITGTRGSGKSTLLREIVDKADICSDIPGIITWCEPGNAVYMRMLGSDDNIVIGTFNPESTSKENRMSPVQSGFDVHGVMLLEQLINSNSERVFIDEIGYLESTSDKYIEKLKLLFEKKRVMAVVRKQETELIKWIIGLEDAYVIDLDE